MGNLILDKNEKMHRYKESIWKLNNFLEDYQKTKALSSEIFVNQEINRNNMLKEIIMKVIGNETSSFKHLILDLEKILKVYLAYKNFKKLY